MSHEGYVRRASHAGSWYSDTGPMLSAQLSEWLSTQGSPSTDAVKAIIAPHAGYSYSGPTAAAAYHNIKPDSVRCVYILGPSHHAYLRQCAISGASEVETPVGNMPVDEEGRRQLLATGLYEVTARAVDEEEHSIEMQLPFLALILARNPAATVLPIMVGQLSDRMAGQYAETLQSAFDDVGSLFVISSDFCHWGKRFQYTPFDNTKATEIHEYIKWLDGEGMKLIEDHNLTGFRDYLETHQNTICGRNPIAVLLTLILKSPLATTTRFVKYAQSGTVQTPRDSSVSYAAAVVTVVADK